jgi:PH (Pleckstrin Homology) domain-containing protein
MTWLVTILVAALGTRVAISVAQATRKSSARALTEDESLVVLQYSIGFRVLMGITLIGFLAVAAFVALWPQITPKDRLLSLVVVLLPCILGTAWWVLESLTRRISVTDAGVSSRSLLGAEVKLKWDEVRSLRYSALNSWLILQGPDHRRVRVSRFLDDPEQFVELVRVRLLPDNTLNLRQLEIYLRLARRAA